jgi:FdhD protein
MTDSDQITPRDAWRVNAGSGRLQTETLAVEAPLQIILNEKPFSVTMRTPGNDDSLVRGWLFSEGIVRPDGKVEVIEFAEVEGFDLARVSIPELYLCEAAVQNQAQLTHAACGYCGKKSFEGLPDSAIDRPQEYLDWTYFQTLEKKMRLAQAAFTASGGIHAAAAFNRQGDLLCLFEDIGRHNAVDKVIGHLLLMNQLEAACVLQVSGRLSFEIINKAIRAGIFYVSAISAPSSLAVDAARASCRTLVAFNREDRFTIYSHPEFINFEKK